ncbi:hypothetical protein AB0C04_24190 [Micromonospora sp. NPDC048909]|uniref:hypothetical protein n=1 Tax=Micromonospora sp. NPDC048909 TaxID=3155643 RepID=UPI0033DF26D8
MSVLTDLRNRCVKDDAYPGAEQRGQGRYDIQSNLCDIDRAESDLVSSCQFIWLVGCRDLLKQS